MQSSHTHLMVLFAGIAFFMYGMSLASDYLQRLMANRVRHLMNRLADRHFIAIVVGILLTVLLQSSGAVTSMLVGLGSAGVVNLTQVMGVIIGTAVGTTITVQIISFNIAQWGLGCFIFSFMVFFTSNRRIIKNIAGVCMGFGLIFYGLELMGQATQYFKTVPLLMEGITYLRKEPFVAFLATTAITAFVHSSAVVIGMAMTLAQSDLISLYDAMFWVYGANVGTTATGLMAAIGANYVGRQVAWAHAFYKIFTVAICAAVTLPLVAFIELFNENPIRDIANGHTILNIIGAVIFYPFISKGAQIIEKMFPPSESEREFGTKFLQNDAAHTPSLAYAQAVRESLRMGDIVVSMVRDSIRLFESEDPELIDDVHQRDNKVDLLFREIKTFLIRTPDKDGQINRQVFELLSFVTDLESAADIVEKNILDLAEKKNRLKVEFSEAGWSEIKVVHKLVLELITQSLSCFQLHDAGLADNVIEAKRALRVKEREFREHHLERLNKGLKATINTSSIHLELLGDYRRIAGLFSNHAYAIFKGGEDAKVTLRNEK
ncbi:MAG: Na/Pi cotransporter family protein [Bdellovibrionia bacterium]